MLRRYNLFAMKLWLTDHFKYRMTERGIDIAHVKRAVKEPDFTKQNPDGTVLARKKIDDERTIEVVYREQSFKDNHDPVMITAYYLS